MEDILNGITEFFEQILDFFSLIGTFITHMVSTIGDLIKFVFLIPSVTNISANFVPSFILAVASATIAIALVVRFFGGGGGS